MKKTLFLILFFTYQNLSATFLPFSSSHQIIRPDDPQSLAMGLTGVSYATGISSICSNSAGLSDTENMEIIYSHFPSTKRGNASIFNKEMIGLSLPLIKNYVIGFQYLFINGPEYSVSDMQGQIIARRKANVKNILATGSKIYKFNNRQFAIGLTLKYLEDWILIEEKRDAFRFDFGIRYKCDINADKWYSIGIAFNDVGNGLKSKSVYEEKNLKILRCGITYCNNNIKNKEVGILGCVEYQNGLLKDVYFYWENLSLGFELQFFEHLFARIGYIYDLTNQDISYSKEYQGLTYGLSFVTNKKIHILYPFKISISYSRGLQDYRELDPNLISVKLIF